MEDILIGSQRITRGRLSEMMTKSQPGPLFVDSVDQSQDMIIDTADSPPDAVTCACQETAVLRMPLVKCSSCSSWSHAPCYGLFTETEQCKSSTHVCQKCSHSMTSDQIDKIADLCLLRRAIYVLIHMTPKTVRAFAANMNTIISVATQIKKRIQSYGILDPKANSRKSLEINWNFKSREAVSFWTSPSPIDDILAEQVQKETVSQKVKVLRR
jgi:hypothetical protein